RASSRTASSRAATVTALRSRGPGRSSGLGLFLGVAAVGREVPEEPLAWGSLGDGVHEQVAADKGALPGGAPAAERLLAVAAAARLVDPDLECLQLLGRVGGEVGIVGCYRGDQRPVRRIHGRQQLVLGVDDDDAVQ